MCETFFGLKHSPFLFAPDVKNYFSVEFMEESRRSIERAVQNGEGIALIFGVSGTGKTLLMQVIRETLEEKYTAVFVSNSRLETPKALFLQLAHDLNLDLTGEESVELRLQILDFARQASPQGAILLFDDAQHLSPAVLEELRLLTDSVGGEPSLFRAVLAGTMDFEETLTLPNLEAFNQRVVSRCYLDSFTGEETSRYIFRQTDGLRIDPPHNAPPLFTDEAKRRIYQLTNGVPRLINQLCRTSLEFAAERDVKNVDGSLVNDAWASLQHIESVCETEQTEPPAVQEPVISPEQIEEIIDRKKKTFQIRQFDSVEFGTLTDSEAVETEVLGTYRSFHENAPYEREYKPPYPEDEDEEFAELEEVPEVYRLPGVPAELPGVPAKLPIALPKRKFIPDNINKQHYKFRRRRLLKKIRHRLGLFAGLLRKADCPQANPTADEFNESDMNAQTLQEYGAAVLDGRPPFVRKDPHYAYQTTTTAPHEVPYPDPKTGVPIMLRWLPEKTGDSERFGVSYTEFLTREKSHQPVDLEKTATQPNPEPVPLEEEPASPIFRTSLNASQENCGASPHSSGLEESFEESQQVGGLAISLTELFQVNSSALQRIEESPEFKSLDEAVQRRLESVIQRITKAAERIEQVAEVSERAGQHISRAAEFVETEVNSALPVYTDLFRQWTEFQDLVTAELESARQRHSEPLKLQSFSRRQVMIERTVPTIDVEALFR